MAIRGWVATCSKVKAAIQCISRYVLGREGQSAHLFLSDLVTVVGDGDKTTEPASRDDVKGSKWWWIAICMLVRRATGASVKFRESMLQTTT